jgi:hypothetical protein
VKTKLQAQSTEDARSLSKDEYYTGVLDAFVKIIRSEGVPGLYVGMPGSLLGSAWQGYVFNYWHSFLRQMYLASTIFPQPPGTVAELTLAYCSGVLSQHFTVPVAVVTTRQQTTPKAERKDMIGTAAEIIQGEDGWTGLWKGLKAGLVLCINPAITYGMTERLKGMLFGSKQSLTAWENFCRL